MHKRTDAPPPSGKAAVLAKRKPDQWERMAKLFRFVLSISLVLSAWLIAFGAACFADGAAEPYPQTDASETGALDGPFRADSFDAFRMLGKVLLALVVIIGLFYLIMKYVSQKKHPFLFGGAVRSLGGVAVGPNKSVQLVKIGRSLYVVGVGENVQLIDIIRDADEIALITESVPGQGNLGRSLFTLPHRLFGRKDEAGSKEEEETLAAAFLEVFEQKMRSVSGRRKAIEDVLSEDISKERSKE
jgi:flagellar protein FliO/FliZ